MLDTKRVLLIDDDHEIRVGARLRLRAAGFDTIEACDGEQGVASAIENRPDAIVLDVRMSRMDGLTALNRLRECEDTKEIPVVMLSASPVDQKASLDGGARFFIRKPYLAQNLISAVKAAVNETSTAGLG